MLQILINFVFKIITSLANSIVTPFLAAITALFPDLGVAFQHVLEYVTTALTYVPFLIDFMLIPRAAIVLLFDYYVIKYSIHLLKVSINFSINIYNKLKI